MLTEIPLIYPEGVKRRRYLVNDGKFEHEASRSHDPVIGTEFLIGSASVSILDEHSYLITCPKPEEPSVLIIIMVETNIVSIELDLSTQDIDVPVKIQAFEDGSRIRLVLADAHANLMMLSLDAIDLSPINVDVLSVHDLMEDAKLVYSGAELESSMISFVNPTLTVVAMSPYALSVDWITRSLSVWSQVAIISTGITDVFFKATDMLLGRTDDSVHMPPIAALTSVQRPDHTCWFFTLHSDATLRRWKLDLAASNLPVEVMTLTIDLPDPSNWINQTHNSIILRSRMYGGSYAVAIHIQSTEHGSTLTVVHGRTDSRSLSSKVQLMIPDGVTSLVDMDLSATNRCQLMALFLSQDHDPVLVTYPPSYTSILSSKPILTPQEYTLDGWAMKEYDRIDSLAIVIDDDDDDDDISVEQALQTVDTHFMKYIFRPLYPRGNGSVAGPLSTTLHKTLSKFVHGFKRDESRSTELECLRAMHEWKRQEDKRPAENSTALTLVRQKHKSVYEASSPQDIQLRAGNEDVMQVDGNEEDFKTQVDAHIQRWRKCLQILWHEENVGRNPLMLLCLPSGHAVLVRSQTISLVIESETSLASTSSTNYLDKVSLAILERIEHTKDKASILATIEQKLLSVIACVDHSADTSELLFLIGGLGNWAMSTNMAVRHESQNAAVDMISIQNALKEMTPQEISNWINRTPVESNLPGLSILATRESNDSAKKFSHQMTDENMRQSACAIYIQSMDSVRRLNLGRCLILTGVQVWVAASRIAFRSYLQALATLWSCGQRVPLPPVTSSQTPRLSESPPNKRLSFGDEPSSIIPGNPHETTVLDARMMQLSQTMASERSISVDCVIIQMASICFKFWSISPDLNTCLGQPYRLLVNQLGVLPSPSNESIASDHPRVALRLLLPSLLITHEVEDSDVTLARNEALAECFLIEANEQTVLSTSHSMRSRAYTLLSLADVEIEPDLNYIQAAFDFLIALGEGRQRQSSVQPTLDVMTAGMLQILYGSSDTTREETRRLCNQKTAHALFSPLFFYEGTSPLSKLTESVRSAIVSLAKVLLLISNLVSHLSILERHIDRLGRLSSTSSSDGTAVTLLEYTQGIISKVESLLPEQIFNSMPEYISLWTRLFRYAESSRQWEIAYKACIRNPNIGLRANNCKRLVKAMVDAGSLDDLIYLCGKVSGVGSHGLDIFEIAAQTLATDNLSNRYTSTSDYPTDYLGNLYALHASTGNWKRAAQAMDLRYVDGTTAVEAATRNPSLNEGLGTKDIVGSAVASVNAMALIEMESDRYLFSGESSAYPNLPTFDEGDPPLKSILKRGRGNDTPIQGEVHSCTPKEDRLLRFMIASDLDGRAVRALAFQKLFMSSLSSDASTMILYRKPPIDVDQALMDTLACHGYFQQAFLVAKAMAVANTVRTGGTKPSGRDLLHDAVSHILLTYIVPLVFGETDKQFTTDKENNFQPPTLTQLHDAISNFGREANGISYICSWNCGLDLTASVTANAAMELLRRATLRYSSASCPLAIEVAERLLDLSHYRIGLPLWLQYFLIGIHGEEPGLFAKTGRSKKLGDPSGLMGLYLKRGLYEEACDVVSTILFEKSRETQASSRLPEKGDIDFVPYQKIDLLWFLVQDAIEAGQLLPEESETLLASRTRMEQSLVKHFDLMKISDMGMQSARILH